MQFLIRALALLAFAATANAAPTITGPVTARIGGEVIVTVTGSTNPRDFVSIVAKGSAEGSYGDYQYVAKPGEIILSENTMRRVTEHVDGILLPPVKVKGKEQELQVYSVLGMKGEEWRVEQTLSRPR